MEGVKSIATGRILTADGVTAEAEGIFILPRWARDAATAESLRTSLGDG